MVPHPAGVTGRESIDSGSIDSGLSRSVLLLRAGFALSRLSVRQLWLGYVGLTGTMTQDELVDLLRGDRDQVPPGEHDLVAHVLNEHFDDLGLGGLVLYAEALQQPLPPLRRSARHRLATARVRAVLEAADAPAAAATERVLPDVDRVETSGCAQDALMTGPPLRTPDGRYLVVRGRLWRATDPRLDSDEVGVLTRELMAARRAKGVARRADDHDGVERAKARVDAAKRSLGERGPVWWDDDEPDLTRHLARTTRYATWFAEHPEGR